MKKFTTYPKSTKRRVVASRADIGLPPYDQMVNDAVEKYIIDGLDNLIHTALDHKGFTIFHPETEQDFKNAVDSLFKVYMKEFELIGK